MILFTYWSRKSNGRYNNRIRFYIIYTVNEIEIILLTEDENGKQQLLVEKKKYVT